MSRRFPDKSPPFGADRFLVIDLEATCDRPIWPRDAMEIIEIGATLVASDGETVLGEFQTFVRPTDHPELTTFCRELTGIGQADIDAAPDYPTALGAMLDWLDGIDGVLFCSWGGFDDRMFASENVRHGVTDPLPTHWNLARAFSGRLGQRRRFTVRGALERVEMTFEGRPHRGIDDARNIARLLPWCLGRASFPPEPPRWVRRARRRALEEAKAARGRRERRFAAQSDGSTQP